MLGPLARFSIAAAVAALSLLLSCGEANSPQTAAIPLVDRFDASTVSGGAEPGEAKPARLWDFSAEGGEGTLGWKAAKGIAGLRLVDGALKGRTTSADSVLWVKLDNAPEPGDSLHHFEFRMRVDKGGKLAVNTLSADADPAAEQPQGWFFTQDLSAGEAIEEVRLQPGGVFGSGPMEVAAVNPINQAGVEFEIESVRLVTQSEQRAEAPTGVSWQGLDNVYRETIAARAPQSFTIDLDAPSNAWLDLNVGSAQAGAITFRVESLSGDRSSVLLERTLTTPQRWEAAPIELADLSGRVSLRFSLASDSDSALGFWGAPTIRVHNARPASSHGPGEAPQGVILFVIDTLRKDHLSLYGHSRETAPNLARMASQGALFKDNITQATWTKVAVTSLVTSLYPTSHRVHEFPDRLSAQATTLAEVYREAGYATVSFATNPFTGRGTNLHQGYEELHESPAFSDPGYASKTARKAVDRAVGWLDRHPDTPFLMYLHVVDPHSPFEPRAPYDTSWADPAERAERMADWERIKKHIKDPFFIRQAVANRAEVEAAGVDREAYLRYQQDWYDGSILGMDVEVGRLLERLESLGLSDDVVIAVVADHGEEFQEHGRMFHGQSAYGELANVPLLLYGQGRIPAGVAVERTVRSIDVMPTLLAISGLEAPPDVQGQSLLPLVAAAASGSEPDPQLWETRPAVTEKATEPVADPDDPSNHESYALVLDGWKLIHHVIRPEERPEYELFDHDEDPLDLHNVADEHPEEVEKLKAELELWQNAVEQAKLPRAEEAVENLPADELERLRNLGYIQ